MREREVFAKRIQDLVSGIENPPSIYLLFGELTDAEMNSLYNHPKIKSMVSITKGEGFGRPLLEFTMTGKPVVASNWSGHKDFLPMDKAIMVGGSLTEVHDSAVDTFILKGSKWFTANYNEFASVLKVVKESYDTFLERSGKLKEINKELFSMEQMTVKFSEIIKPYTQKPERVTMNLPKLTKLK